jgi:hypothetical protein
MRFILDNTFLIYETIHCILFLKLDLLKAYDKLDFRFLFLGFQGLGLPITFIQMTQLLFLEVEPWISIFRKFNEAFSI